eukprot:1336204-Amphidinium_carterae.2
MAVEVTGRQRLLQPATGVTSSTMLNEWTQSCQAKTRSASAKFLVLPRVTKRALEDAGMPEAYTQGQEKWWVASAGKTPLKEYLLCLLTFAETGHSILHGQSRLWYQKFLDRGEPPPHLRGERRQSRLQWVTRDTVASAKPKPRAKRRARPPPQEQGASASSLESSSDEGSASHSGSGGSGDSSSTQSSSSSSSSSSGSSPNHRQEQAAQQDQFNERLAPLPPPATPPSDTVPFHADQDELFHDDEPSVPALQHSAMLVPGEAASSHQIPRERQQRVGSEWGVFRMSMKHRPASTLIVATAAHQVNPNGKLCWVFKCAHPQHASSTRGTQCSRSMVFEDGDSDLALRHLKDWALRGMACTSKKAHQELPRLEIHALRTMEQLDLLTPRVWPECAAQPGHCNTPTN